MDEDQRTGARGSPWTQFEIESVVSAYNEMLRKELRGEAYTKADVVRALRALMPERTRGSVELKLQNISAIRDEEGSDWIDGYKPMRNYQHDLRTAVVGSMGVAHRIGEALADYESAAVAAPTDQPLSTDDVMVGVPSGRTRDPRQTSVNLTGSSMSALRDYRRRKLGTAGEEWVLELEHEQLRRVGRSDLADQVRWVAREDGDGAGYDIRSYRQDGSERLIEVKTTNLGVRTPFYITRWEIEISRRNPSAYSLYRVHGFTRDPRLYVLDGSVKDRVHLEPKVFLGIPL